MKSFSKKWNPQRLVLGVLLFSSFQVHAQWTVVGDVYASDPSTHQSLVIDNEGVPAVALKDGSQLGKVSVITLEDDSWENIGAAGFSMDGFSGTDQQDLKFDSDNTPYVAFRDLNNDLKPSVMKYVNGTWEYVGMPGFTTGAVSYVSLALKSDGTPYVAFREAPLADKCSVMMYNGSEWVYVGEEGFSTWDSVSAYQSLAFDSNDNLYLAFQEEWYGDATSVMTYNGDEWIYVGGEGFSAGAGSFQSLAISNSGQLFVGYRDNENDGKCTVMTYSDNDWVPVGPVGFSPEAVSYVTLQIDPLDRLVVGFRDWANSGRTSVMRFENDEWSYVGDPGFSSSSANHQSLALNEFGHMFIAFEQGDVEVQRFVVDGCTNPFACNYELDATDDDGSCVILEIYEIDGELNPAPGSTQTYTYTETAGSTYEWTVTNGTIISGQGTATIEVEWGDTGEGSVTVVETNAELCESPPVLLDISIPLDVFQTEFSRPVLWPNPSAGVLNVKVVPELIGAQVVIRDTHGQLIQQRTITSTEEKQEIDAPSGLYIISVVHLGTELWKQKWVIK
jgi:hypothetical protein